MKASNAEAGDLFGTALSLSGDTLVVGANAESSSASGINGNETNNLAFGSGAAYVFTRNGTTWNQQAYLKASNAEIYDGFGTSVSASGDTIVVGAPYEFSNAMGTNGNQADNSASESGAAYVFTRNGVVWNQQAYLKASNTEAFDTFGSSMALSGDTLVIGAPFEDSSAVGVNGNQTDNSGTASGAAYVYSFATFADVSFSYWAHSFIERLAAAGVTGGCGTGIYCPEATVTRAQMAVFLLKGMHGSSYAPPAVGVSTGFGDVTTNYWAAAWIKQLAAEGITSGCGGGNYCPDATVTRAQMAIFLLKAKHGSSYSPPNASGVFTDVPVGYWSDKWIEQLAVEGVTSGCGNGNYCPDDSVTRAQMAVFLVKAFNLP